MILRKWNYQKKNYDKYEVPNNWKCAIYHNDLDEIVNCAHCGKELRHGDSYTSMEIHTLYGFGYDVCEKCYKKEWERRKRFRIID